MDNVMHAMRNKSIVETWIDITMLNVVGKFLEDPSLYEVYENETFEDFCIPQLVALVIEIFLEDMTGCSSRRFYPVKEAVLEEWTRKMQRRLLDELYLQIFFAEDVMRLVSEVGIMLRKAVK